MYNKGMSFFPLLGERRSKLIRKQATRPAWARIKRNVAKNQVPLSKTLERERATEFKTSIVYYVAELKYTWAEFASREPECQFLVS